MTRRQAIVVLGLLAVGCVEGRKAQPVPRTPSPYTRLGGEAAMLAAVDRFADKVIQDRESPETLRAALTGPDAARTKRVLAARLGAVLGGPYPNGTGPVRAALGPLTAESAQGIQRLFEQALAEGGGDAEARQEAAARLTGLLGR